MEATNKTIKEENNKIKESYKDFINQFPKEKNKVSFKDYKMKWLEMNKEIKESQERENQRLNKLSEFIREVNKVL